MIILRTFALKSNRYAHERKTKNGDISMFDTDFCTAQERQKSADEKKSNK